MTREAPRGRRGFLLALALIVAVLVAARRYRPDDAPFVPRDDHEILERLPAGSGADPAAEATGALEAELARAPTDLTLACRVARAHIDAARASGDARRLSYAEAALAPFWSRAAPPTATLLLRATIRQSRHEFEAALVDLDRLLALEPQNAQAWLTRATVLGVLARYDDARESCHRLRGLVSPLVDAACQAPIDSVTGDAAGVRQRLDGILRDPTVSGRERAWIRSLAGEAAMYAGDLPDAEVRLRAAVADDPTDPYTRGLLADVLLDQARDEQVLALIRTDEPNEVLSLRRAIAAQHMRVPDADVLRKRLADGDAALRARGDGTHRREEARRLLELEHDARAALAAAQLDFAAQKEPWDARVLLQSAAAVAATPALRAEATAAARPALAWLRQSGCKWPPLRAAAAALEAAVP